MSYYTDLGILPTASMEEISIAYNNLMSEDIDLDDKIRYNKSFATLENYNSRRKYDNLMDHLIMSIFKIKTIIYKIIMI